MEFLKVALIPIAWIHFLAFSKSNECHVNETASNLQPFYNGIGLSIEMHDNVCIDQHDLVAVSSLIEVSTII